MEPAADQVRAALSAPVRSRVAKRKTISITKTSDLRTISDDLYQFGVEGLRAAVREVVTEEVAKERRKGNMPSAIFTDGKVGKSIAQVDRRVRVIFGEDMSDVLRRIKQVVESTTMVPHRWVVGRGSPDIASGRVGIGDVLLLVSGDEELPIRNIYWRFGLGFSPRDAMTSRAAREPRREGFVGAAARAARQVATPALHVRASFRRGTPLNHVSQFSIARGAPKTAFRPGSVAFIVSRPLHQGGSRRRR